jgi:hypothetical protein
VKRHLLVHTRMYTGFQCLWDRCIHEEEYATIDDLSEHIDTVHIPKLVVDNGYTRNGKSPLPFLPPTSALPKLPSSPVPTYVLTSYPIPAALPSFRGGVAHRTRRSSDKVYPIMPLRDPDDYWPVNGEADVHNDNYWPSSSFFPRIMPIDRNAVETKWLAIQRNGRWEKGLGIQVRKRSVCVPLFDAGEAMRKRKIEIGEEREALRKRVKSIGDVKGKGKAVDVGGDEGQGVSERDGGGQGTDKRYPIARVLRASRNRAIRKTGRSVGIAAIEEMIAFEAQGVELGELPETFSFTK